MIIKPELLTPEPLEARLPLEKRFDQLPREVHHALAVKGGQANARSPKRHKFTPSETHRGGVIRGAQKTMEARDGGRRRS